MSQTLILPRIKTPEFTQPRSISGEKKATLSFPQPADFASGWRHEWKYVVPHQIRTPLIADLSNFVMRDAHSNSEGYYTVRSLYFDSVDWKCFNEKLSGETQRFKLRIRAYVHDCRPTSPYKLEVKWRDGERVCKTGCTVDAKTFEALQPALNGPLWLDARSTLLTPGLAGFQYLKQRHAMRPIINLEYRRRAMTSKLERDCRITLDENLQAWSAGDLNDDRGFHHSFFPRSQSVLEVKCTTLIPIWLDQLLRKYNLTRQTMSKYATAVRQCYPGLLSNEDWGVLD